MPSSEENSSNKAAVAKTVSLTEKDMKDAARLFRLLADPMLLATAIPDLAAAPGAQDRESLVSRARIVLNCRKLRERYFKPVIFGEPAWDILLVLYIAEHSSGKPTMTRLAEWIDTPLSTVVRWMNFLEEERLVERQGHPTDKRTVFVRLLEKGRNALDSYLGAVPG